MVSGVSELQAGRSDVEARLVPSALSKKGDKMSMLYTGKLAA